MFNEYRKSMNSKRSVIFVVAALPCYARSRPRRTRRLQSAADPAYQQSFDQWKSELVEDLKQEWLPLAGLFWLKQGENSFGTDPKNAIVFPKGPAQAGSFTLQGKTVTAKFATELTQSSQAKPVTSGRTSA